MKPDKTDQILRSKLHDMEVAQGVPSWDDFQSARKHPNIIRRFVPYAAAVAAMLAAVLWLFDAEPSVMQPPTSQPIAQVPKLTELPIEDDNIEQNQIEVESKPVVHYAAHNESMTQNREESGIVIEQEMTDKQEFEEERQPASDSKTEQQSEPVKKQSEKRYVEAPVKVRAKAKRGNSGSIIAMTPFVSIGSGISSAQKPLPLMLSESSVVSNLNYVQLGPYKRVVNFMENDFSHNMPITFGVGVDFSITDRFSLGSGIVYSYLKSKASYYESFTYRYIQQVNYLGVPLTASYKIVKGKVLDVYGKVGVMGELSVASSARTDVYRNDTFLSSEEIDVSPDGLQMSLNAGVGLNVSVSPLVGIYVEPGLSHYIKNDNHPLTYYTQSPLQFNLRAGVKFQF